jgi:hypothetical protein
VEGSAQRMSGTMIAIYRVPTPRAARVGQVRVIKDRNNRLYVEGSKISNTNEIGDYTALNLADGRVYYVRTDDFQQLTKNKM